MPEEEFELIPVSPLRKLEKKIEELESTKQLLDVREFLKDIVGIIKMNQEVVHQIVRANDALTIELSKIPGRLDTLISNLNELLTYIKTGSEEEYSPKKEEEKVKPIESEVITQLLENNKRILELNEKIVTTLEEIEKRTRKPTLPPLKKQELTK
ncbi:MAG: hypothetical protein RMJ17_04135 [Candidatus Aenigmarchaeota archaeon]|nr:hypothetical protein [Candidatus Aenigmarchaeota archaeon]MDW8149746.1 hypothetical protein [Candidatus Aenigmarchaeota archaeon]